MATGLLDPSRGALEAPIRAEIFGALRFQQHGRSLGQTHAASAHGRRAAAFFPRLRDNITVLREAHHYIGLQERAGQHVSPAGEWLLDNFHIVGAQLKEIHDGLPRRYFQDLPVLVGVHLAGLPRVYGVAWAFVAHTDSAFNEELLLAFLDAYQETRELTLGELWALPTTLRVVLIENLRRLAERVAASKAAREAANQWCDALPANPQAEPIDLYSQLEVRGVEQAFALQIAQRLNHPASASLAPADAPVRRWLAQVLSDSAGAQAQQQAQQAANNLSVSNAITSLRLLGDTDWRSLIGRTSALMRLMQQSDAYRAERDDTQDATLHAIERLARRCEMSELSVAQSLLQRMQSPPADSAAAAAAQSPRYWLSGPGRPLLRQALGLRASLWPAPSAWRRHLALPAYLATLIAGSVGLTAWFVLHKSVDPSASAWALALVSLMAAAPASEAVIAIVNRLISESAQPRRLPRLAFRDGIAPEHRVLVVIPTLLTSPEAVNELAGQLERHHLANPERHAQFALLSDPSDADAAQTAADGAVLGAAVVALQQLNLRYPAGTGAAPRFVLLHRERRFSVSEQRWIGWERKRGKLEQLIALLAGAADGRDGSPFVDLGELSRLAPDTPYVVTLDGDTQLPPGSLRELVGVAAHPLNHPHVDPQRRRVDAGFGILQPRVVTPLPAPGEATPFHWLFAGACGLDPYSAATSEVYQDLFGAGTFAGKGLLNVQAVHAVLEGRLPEGLVLSHDLLEGSIARCGGVSDITLIEDAPMHPDVAASRVHRWTRGDWQLLPLLARAGHYGISAVNRWKMVDNLRRSLVAPLSLLLLVASLAGWGLTPGAALVLVAGAFGAGPLLGAIAALAPSRDEIALRHFYRGALTDLARAALSSLWQLAQLAHQAQLGVDAIARALYRMAVSHRRLLQWTTAAAAQANARHDLAALLRKHVREPVVALALGALLWALGSPTPVLAGALCLLWAASPVWTWWGSRPYRTSGEAPLALSDQDYLRDVARDTWRLFEYGVGAADHDLPPDNIQTFPRTMVAHRTSPTNIGLYLVSTACAQGFGWISTHDMLERGERTLATLIRLTRHRGHFLNWYDTLTLAPLPPAYVSTVDSGNLCGCLVAAAQACEALASQPPSLKAAGTAIAASKRRLLANAAALDALSPRSAIDTVLALADPLARLREDRAGFTLLLDCAQAELAPWMLDPDMPGDLGQGPGAWLVHDHLATLRSHAADAGDAGGSAHDHAQDRSQRLRALGAALRALAEEAEFGFLYNGRRRLFHIGYRVAEHQLDASFYDLLASESRLASLWAIGKGDVPVAHWATLGRPCFADGSRAGLRSWSGSMFEYLMPTLLLDEPQGSVLASAAQAAVHTQRLVARAQGVPWGVSESAYAASDHTLAYQYAPQGVAQLALRRTPADELVVAPYATALAALVLPAHAAANLRQLQALHTRDAFGFVEALDYTPERQTGQTSPGGPGSQSPATRVATFMAHHQGMTIVALADVLLGAVARRWAMAEPRLQAVSALLQERVPREVSLLFEPPPAPAAKGRQASGPAMRREIEPGSSALQPTHLLSNGRYSVALRSNGAGWSRFGNAYVTRWRDDALRDACGSFLYLRRAPHEAVVSLSQHPAPDPAAHYEATFHSDRVCLDAHWPDLRSHCSVWVSPEDDIELRQVELHNLGGKVLEVELMSAFDVSLTDARADEAHPAFVNLFVRADWNAQERALHFERKPRLATEEGLHAVHFVAHADRALRSVAVQASREQWLGRQRDAAHPMARYGTRADSGECGTGLDPIAALSLRLSVPPYGTARVCIATAAAPTRAPLEALVDKYRQASIIERSSLMSTTLAAIRLREQRISAGNLAAIQTLTTPLALLLARPRAALDSPGFDRRTLWRFGISGDRPILLVSVGAVQGVGMLRALVQALKLWTWGGLGCDLVVLNSEPASYLPPVQQELAVMAERFNAERDAAAPPARACALYVLRSADTSPEERASLEALARVHLNADGRALTQHVQELADWHDAALDERSEHAVAVLGVPLRAAVVRTPDGRFSDDGARFGFDVSAACRPSRPWINVLANPGFGAQVSEAGAGYSWAGNSRMHQLTAWSNDAVSDPASEWLLLQDLRSHEVWNLAPGSGAASSTYRVEHEQGSTRIRHRRGELEIQATWCVDAALALKQVCIRIDNHGSQTRHLRVVNMVEWMLGASRSDRQSVTTAKLASSAAGGAARAVMATQLDAQGGFGGATAFVALRCDVNERDLQVEWTCDRREFFDSRGCLALPDHLGEAAGPGLDPCAALAASLALGGGASTTCTFLLGHAQSPEAARALAPQALRIDPAQRLRQVHEHWDNLLGAVSVKTPDPLFDALVNRWLLYQTVACRIWARAGFYQAGGAFGFRDQLQDAMALALSAPAMLRSQLLLSASRQFPEGDVQHWWHAPTGAGVRTHFSDDLLWLPHATVHYLARTGDAAVLDESVPFIDGVPVPPGAEDVYAVTPASAQGATLYEHCARTLDRSLATGAHGLPLMGTGDWNDGMNRVGHEGRGESVWLGWFLVRVVQDFAPIAQARGDSARAERWRAAARGWQTALRDQAWDGEWYVRAYFDDGTPLGSKHSAECRIDLIAQAWSVLSGAAPLERQELAMASVERLLVDPEAGLVRLLDPPLAQAVPSAGYIQAYPAGVRENGGQYSHAAVWALMAHAGLGHADAAWRMFKMLSPAHRAADPRQSRAYELEPYVMPGDIYSQPPYVGRGGWSWYTGSAAWLHRAAVESIAGLEVEGERVRLSPQLPSHWPELSISLRRGAGMHEFIVCQASEQARIDAALARGAQPRALNEWFPLAGSGATHRYLVVMPPRGVEDLHNEYAVALP